jgi:hypothetical protein
VTFKIWANFSGLSLMELSRLLDQLLLQLSEIDWTR